MHYYVQIADVRIPLICEPESILSFPVWCQRNITGSPRQFAVTQHRILYGYRANRRQDSNATFANESSPLDTLARNSKQQKKRHPSSLCHRAQNHCVLSSDDSYIDVRVQGSRAPGPGNRVPLVQSSNRGLVTKLVKDIDLCDLKDKRNVPQHDNCSSNSAISRGNSRNSARPIFSNETPNRASFGRKPDATRRASKRSIRCQQSPPPPSSPLKDSKSLPSSRVPRRSSWPRSAQRRQPPRLPKLMDIDPFSTQYFQPVTINDDLYEIGRSAAPTKISAYLLS